LQKEIEATATLSKDVKIELTAAGGIKAGAFRSVWKKVNRYESHLFAKQVR